MRQTINRGRVAYEPNSLGNGCPMQTPEALRGYVSYAEKIDAHKVRERSESFNDHFSQATLFWASQTAAEQEHIVHALQFELGMLETTYIRERIVQLLVNVDEALARRVAGEIGVTEVTGDLSYLQTSTAPQPSSRRGAAAPGNSPALSMARPAPSLKSRRVAILAAEGVNGGEVAQLKEALQAEGVHATLIAKNLGHIHSADGEELAVDKSFRTASSTLFDAVYVPGGEQSVAALNQQGNALHFINEAFKHAKPIGATGAGVDLLAGATLPGISLSSSGLSDEHGVVTLRDAATLDDFARGFLDAMRQHRHWGRDQME